MSKYLFILLITTLNLVSLGQTSYTWNGSISSDWTVGNNWTPVGTPISTDHVTIVTTANDPVLSGNVTITDFTMTDGSLDLGGFTLTTEGDHVFTAGTISNGTLLSTSAGTSTYTNTTFSADAIVDVKANAITINGGIFNGTTTLELTGTGNTTGTGNATFNGTTLLHNSGTGYFRTNGNMTFNGTTELRVSGSNYLLLELTSGSTYNGALTLTLTSTATNQLRMGYIGTTTYNNSITFNNESENNIRFGEQASSVNNFTSGNLTIGTFSSGDLILNNFNQTGATTQNLTLTGTAVANFTDVLFEGEFSLTSPNLYIRESTFDENVTLTKTTGTTSNNLSLIHI